MMSLGMCQEVGGRNPSDCPPCDSLVIPREYLRAVLEESVPNANRSGEMSRRLLYSLARNLGQSVTYKTLSKDVYGIEADA